MLLGHNSNPIPMPKGGKKIAQAKSVLFRVEESMSNQEFWEQRPMGKKKCKRRSPFKTKSFHQALSQNVAVSGHTAKELYIS